MVWLATTDPRVVVRPSDLDADPWFLNCLNGTIDLCKGTLRPHNRRDLITKLSPVGFDPDARSDLWEEFLERATGGDNSLKEYVQQAAGMCLAGGNPEELIFIFFGPGGSAKSTLLESVKAAIGDYAMTAVAETFLQQTQQRGARNDLARLQGTRL